MTVRYTPAFIENLPIDHHVEFNIDGSILNIIGSYRNMIHQSRCLCAGREVSEIGVNTVNTIPLTVVGIPPIYTIHIRGNFEGYDLNLVLLAGKEDDYLYAIRDNRGWREIADARFSVEGAKLFGNNFIGSYTNIRNGIWGARINFGFGALARALIALQRRTEYINSFLCVVANIFEAIRYIAIENYFIHQVSKELWYNSESVNLSLNARRLIHSWDYFSERVLSYRIDGVWMFAWRDMGGDDENEDYTEFDVEGNKNQCIINLSMVPKIIGLLKNRN